MTAAAALALACVASASLQAAEYPAKPVTLIVPYKAGGSTETMAQILSKAISRNLGQKVIVRTKPGAGGAIGSTLVAKAKPDGYTLLFAAAATITWEPLSKKGIAYTADSFSYVAGVTDYQMAFVTTPGRPYSTFAELIAYAKKNPGMNVADQGGISRAFINYIGKKENIDWTAIPTRGGGEMVPFMFGNKVDLAWSGGVHNKYGDKFIVLASCLSERLASAPKAPSMQELYGIAMPGTALIAAPKGTPAAAVAKVQAAIEASMDDPDFSAILGRMKFPKTFVPAAQLTKNIAAMTVSLKKVLAAIQ
ncbi:MAG TPA: tripartite tricarboxylate transporter substrate binding protein [Alphaproteobacteria bacterium]|nr:tripartite tricarboxylate transporter substrate binding protein [Alphaproteobacteria bacterium]MDP6270411.1 tripartite tricarboxylate transporter substrate binding protein [Alphaproteobacteria bacterium]MDP7426646.1 tripartite tricarboxylate transporter substrate binding protein [Alphaproteobacteria bacterium]HJM51451.1 tripartite tricarboxylate transporter substrate binding protein [Alphaproteobacteria bacterium]